MNAQRVGLTALRRAAFAPASVSPMAARAMILRPAMAIQSRHISTEKLSSEQADAVLAKQRLNRPVSPHLTIYDPAQTWYGASIMQRFTGMAGSGVLYAGALAYLAAPVVGWHLESASLVAFVAGLPVAVKGAAKFGLAFPLVFHSINGVRHLFWDTTAKMFSKPEIAKTTTNIIWAASLVSTLAIALLL